MNAESGGNAPVNTPSPVYNPQPNYPAQPAPQYQNPTYPVFAPRPPKDRSVAIILEILPGLFGFLGFGWMYAGNIAAGAIWLICFLLWTFVAVVIDVLTAGFGVCLTLPVSIVLIIISTVSLNSYTKQHQELFGI